MANLNLAQWHRVTVIPIIDTDFAPQRRVPALARLLVETLANSPGNGRSAFDIAVVAAPIAIGSHVSLGAVRVLARSRARGETATQAREEAGCGGNDVSE